MHQSSSIEIHFYSQYEAAIIFETFAQGDERKSVTVRSFVSYTLRQLQNLGAAGEPLARLLAAMGKPIDVYLNYHGLVHGLKTPQEMAIYMPFIAALGVDMARIVESVTAFAMLRASAGGDVSEIARTLWPETAHLVDYRRAEGSKRFKAAFDLQENRVLIELEAKGFGLFGQGVNYFAPMSVVLLLKYLTDKYDKKPGDSEFADRLRQAAQASGQAFLEGRIAGSGAMELPVQIDMIVSGGQSR